MIRQLHVHGTRWIALLAAVLLMAMLVVLETQREAHAATTYRNPVINRNLPDPAVIKGADGRYHLYATGGTNDNPFPHYVSTDMVNWVPGGRTFKVGATPACTAGDKIQWAPDVHKVADFYVLTYTCGPDNGRRIGYAVSGSPGGPFAVRGILVDSGEFRRVQRAGDGAWVSGPDEYGTIDSHIFRSGTTYLLSFGGGHIVNVKLTVNTTNRTISTVNSTARRVITGYHLNGRWLTHEGAWMEWREGYFYLFYSVGDWDVRSGAREYRLRVERSKSALGPFTTVRRNVITGSGTDFRGPGHNSAVRDDAGNRWLVYHAWHDGKRVVMIDRMRWTKDGWPYISGGTPSRTVLAAPVNK